MNITVDRSLRQTVPLSRVGFLLVIRDSFAKLDPRVQVRNPVMFVVYLTSTFFTILGIAAAFGATRDAVHPAFMLSIAAWLWFTVMLANFAEAVAKGRARAGATRMRSMRRHGHAKRLLGRNRADYHLVEASALRHGDVVLVEANDTIPADAEVIEGVATVNESAVTGQSAPVLRAAGGDISSVSGGTRVLSDWLLVRVTSREGQGVLDRMLATVKGAQRSRAPNEQNDIALSILVAMLTVVSLLAMAILAPALNLSPMIAGESVILTVSTFVALLACLIPTTIAALLPVVGIAGMDRMVRANVIATSGRAVEAAGNVNIMVIDKTGTITVGDRHATAFYPAPGVYGVELADAAQLASLADDTPEGQSIVSFARRVFRLRGRDLAATGYAFQPFCAQGGMSGVDVEGRKLRKGAADVMRRFVETEGGSWPIPVSETVDRVARSGATPLAVADGCRVLGVIELSDTIREGVRARFAELRGMGIKTVMVTGDNPVTAIAIAAECGVDEFVAQAAPDKKLELIRKNQREGRVVAMCGDGRNDAPALAQADVALAMNTGAQAAKEAANMVDLDSNPTKLIQVVGVGKQMLATRGALTTFSIADAVAKCFVIVPVVVAATHPALDTLNVMRLTGPESAILSALIYNALITVLLIPLALRGVNVPIAMGTPLLHRNLLIYGLGGTLLPFAGIKLIDVLLTACGWM